MASLGDLELVEMVHPAVANPARVPRTAVGQHVLAGWRPKDEVDAETARAADPEQTETTATPAANPPKES